MIFLLMPAWWLTPMQTGSGNSVTAGATADKSVWVLPWSSHGPTTQNSVSIHHCIAPAMRQEILPPDRFWGSGLHGPPRSYPGRKGGIMNEELNLRLSRIEQSAGSHGKMLLAMLDQLRLQGEQ